MVAFLEEHTGNVSSLMVSVSHCLKCFSALQVASQLDTVLFCPCRAVVSQLVTGYLPSVILHFLSSYVPSIMKLFSTMQGFVSISGIEQSACNKMLRFTIWTVFFANVLTGSVVGQLQIFYNPIEIPTKLAVVVPAQVVHAFLVLCNEP